MPLRDQDNFDNDLLDIVPERMGGDSERPRKSGGKGRLLLTLGLALSAAVATVAAGWHIFLRDQPAMPQGGVPTITADQAPLKARPDDRGGMDVPNQDKLVYNRMGGNTSEPQVERLLPPPEQPRQPPAPPPLPPTPAQAQAQAPAQPPAVPAAKPGEPPNAKAAPPPQVAVMPQGAPTQAPPPQQMMPQPQMQAMQPQTPPQQPMAPAPAQGMQGAPQQAVMPVPPKQPPAAPPQAAAPAPQPPPQQQQAAVAPAKPAVGAQGSFAQLAALRDRPSAEKEWARIQKANSDLLGDKPLDVMEVDLGAKGVFFRVRTGPFEPSQTKALCDELAKRKVGCIVAK